MLRLFFFLAPDVPIFGNDLEDKNLNSQKEAAYIINAV